MSKIMEDLNRLFWIHTIRGCIAEFIGVGLFVLIGSLSTVSQFTTNVVYGTTVGSITTNVAIAHGITIVILVISLGHISGGHFNPAVTLGIAIAGGVHWLRGILYVIFQLLGAFIGALFVRALTHDELYETIKGGITVPNIPAAGNWDEALICEAVLTYFLVQTVLCAAVDFDGDNKIAPFAIGFTVMVDVLAGGDISGASMNPARSFGPALAFQILQPNFFSMNTKFQYTQWTYHYIYWVGPFVGAVVAALIYRLFLGNNEKRWIMKVF